MSPVNCEEAELHIGTEPASLPAAVEAHAAGCPSCAVRLRESLALERALQRAFELPVPGRVSGGPGLGASARRATRGRRFPGRRFDVSRWALAASVLLATLAGLFLWAGRPADTLAADVVAHMAGEPQSWDATQPLAPAAIERVLAASGLRLDAASADVVYAQSCWFRGHWVPHLVVRSARGPVTVMVLPAEHVAAAEHYNHAGYDETLVPFGHGGLALIDRDGAAVTPEVVDRLRASLHTLRL